MVNRDGVRSGAVKMLDKQQKLKLYISCHILHVVSSSQRTTCHTKTDKQTTYYRSIGKDGTLRFDLGSVQLVGALEISRKSNEGESVLPDLNRIGIYCVHVRIFS